MKISRHISFCTLLILISGWFSVLSAQPGYKIDLKKEAPYDNRVLKAEKTKDGKLKQPKKFFQNLTTYFNYVFNANVKLNEVLERAKASHKDDYSLLLPFYNYSLEITSRDSIQLDSVIYKAQTGILMHDLRNDWGDELYLLWGASYLLQNQLDSASLMFQFINYAYAEKEKDGYYMHIGSPKDGEQALTISTKEKKGFFHNTSSRNNSFLWQARTLIEAGKYTQAVSLINTLKNDPNFPTRLNLDLKELQAYWFYKQNMWDSSATNLTIAADGAESKFEKARWEYLAAQMFELAGKNQEAQDLYAKSISHTPDPIMEVYARLNLVKLNKNSDENYIDRNIAELLKMAKRDKYEDYRDVIYFMAAQMEMERNNLAAAQELLLLGVKNSNGNNQSKNKAFLQIADLSYEQKKYIQAASFYDSLQVNTLAEADAQRVAQRKPVASKISNNLQVVTRQDSLQRIAAMPENEQAAYINKLVKQIRKAQGLKEETVVTSGRSNAPATAPDLFNNNQKGEWYFYNSTLKNRGVEQFKSIWGTRPNTDNWRRFSTSNQQLANGFPNTLDVPGNTQGLDNAPTSSTLVANLPITPEKLQVSNDSIKNALFNLGNIYLNEADDYASTIAVLEELRRRFPDFQKMDQVLFNLYYAYTKAGNTAQAAQIKSLMQSQYPASNFTSIANTGKGVSQNTPSAQATKDYEAIYNSFIEGKFTEALEAKKRADSVHKTTAWQPQLLYIESVYHIQQRDDSAAKIALQAIIAQDRNSELAKKSENLLQVLSRRKQIEDELAQYEIQNVAAAQPAVQQPPVPKVVETIKPEVTVVKEPEVQKPVQKPVVDTVAKKPVPPPPISGYAFNAETQHLAVIILDKVDPVFVNEAKNAFARFNREKFSNLPLDVNITDLNADTRFVIVGNFPNAQAATDYAQLAKSLAPKDIVPWLKADKYAFSIITARNLEILKTSSDLNSYRKFLEQHLPGKF